MVSKVKVVVSLAKNRELNYENYTLKDKLGIFVFMQHFCLYISHIIGILN